jgi:hypothetical protein
VKLHGWCERCHKIRRVTVHNHGMLMAGAHGVPTGVCDQCEDDERERRR